MYNRKNTQNIRQFLKEENVFDGSVVNTKVQKHRYDCWSNKMYIILNSLLLHDISLSVF